VKQQPITDQPTALQASVPSSRKLSKLRVVFLSIFTVVVLIIVLAVALNGGRPKAKLPATRSTTGAFAKSAAAQRPSVGLTDVKRLLASLAANGAPCTAVSFVNGGRPGSVSPYADCTGASQGDTAICMFNSHAYALAYAHAQITTGKSLEMPTAEVVGSNWVVNTVPAYAHKVRRAIGGRIITWAPSKGATPASSPAAPNPAPPQVLLSLSGSGIESSSPFLVTENQLTVIYSYNCAAFGSVGNFIADLLSGNQASLGYDDQVIANALGPGGTVTTTIYPQDPGTDYHLAVNSECSWSVTVKS
jgi:hypothetical protein